MDYLDTTKEIHPRTGDVKLAASDRSWIKWQVLVGSAGVKITGGTQMSCRANILNRGSGVGAGSKGIFEEKQV